MPIPTPTTTEHPPAALDQLYVTAWEPDDPIGFDPRSSYVEHFWLGVLGPSTVWFLRHCRAALDGARDGVVLDLHETAASLGIGHRGGRNSPMIRTIDRACRFHVARRPHEAHLEVRTLLPPVNRNQLGRLPDAVRHRHDDYVRPGDPELRRRARRLALGLVECGEGVDLAEQQLGQWRVDASLAAEAVQWAWTVHQHAEAHDPLGAGRTTP